MSLFPTSFEAIIFSSMTLLWILSEVVGGGIIPMLRRSGGGIKKKDGGSVLVIRVLMYVSVFMAILLALKHIAMLPGWFFYPGIILMVTGILMRQWAIFILGRFFTVIVSVQKNQKVVDYGPYRLIRHPSYLGLFMIMIGMGLALGSWGGILILLSMNGLALGYRIYIEEKVLVSELGYDYVQYIKRTKRLIPFIL
ncbi:MAG TPA: isoprenylcysteine carboxylmethyltransferase family protein [Methanocella sp.]|nr:isoprenylcysteine carboxylmethyltransferase family protein [Methanocella sp.]